MSLCRAVCPSAILRHFAGWALCAALAAPAWAAETCTPASYGAPQPTAAPLRAEGSHFKDPAGRVVLLRGVNATGDAKVPPFRPLATPGLLAPLPGWGLNTVRLLFNWEAFEPTRCHYDDSYLAYYEQVVSEARALGLYVIVDFHQDAYSRFSLGGCGEGFPSWAVVSSVALQTPKNDASCSGWGASIIRMTVGPKFPQTASATACPVSAASASATGPAARTGSYW